jgi:uncharacterized membrane protein
MRRNGPEGATLGGVLLRMLREPRTGRPAPIARLLALVVVLGLVLVSVPVLLPVLRWVLSLL